MDRRGTGQGRRVREKKARSGVVVTSWAQEQGRGIVSYFSCPKEVQRHRVP